MGADTETCIHALQARREELRRALGGRSLLVLVSHGKGQDLRVMLTRSGLAELVPAGEPFEPDVEVHGSQEDVAAFLAGRTSLGDAILRRVVRLRINEDEAASFNELRRLVSEVVAPSASD